jgi:hypothetical protein
MLKLTRFVALVMLSAGASSGQIPEVVFEGTVKQLHASVIDSIKPSPNGGRHR